MGSVTCTVQVASTTHALKGASLEQLPVWERGRRYVPRTVEERGTSSRLGSTLVHPHQIISPPTVPSQNLHFNKRPGDLSVERSWK